ncbi:MAG: hypothetical protein RBR78_10420 [Flavobacteriaceae bacterium]|jgi:hypothetical protein|nr:hypothetical protein [Flavobacteriaceae bacterium]
MRFKIDYWLKFSLINLFVVALLGTLMRYKIGFDFPFFVQKHLLHSHSHFAFSGWISHTLMVLMVYYLKNKIAEISIPKYTRLIIANLVCSYGMLIFFIIQGYGFWSITFSTLSIIVSYFFAYAFIKDLKKIPEEASKKWFWGALIFYVLSSLGTFFLAYTLASKNFMYNPYLASVYYYLHFQYNGWFFFACMGLLTDFLKPDNSENRLFNKAFWLLFISTFVTYSLSVLWLKMPQWLYILTIVFSVVQFVVWLRLLFYIIAKKAPMLKSQPVFLQNILKFVGFCVSMKFLFQMVSVIPSLSQFVFGVRTIVIAYLHLILLAIITLFLLYYIYTNKFLALNKSIKNGIILFAIGVFLNELVLGIQGMSAFGYILIPNINIYLFGVAVILLISSGWIALKSYAK